MILITGGTGFVGRNLIRELQKDSWEMRCLVRDPDRASGLKRYGCQLVRGDVTDMSSVLNAVSAEIKAVIHLVGILVETKGVTFKRIHVEGTRNVLEACRWKGVKRYLHISALGTRPKARSAYHRTKWEAEELIRASGLDYTIFRPSVIFGAQDRFTNLLARAMRFPPVVLIPGDGKNRMQPVFVKDVTAALSRSLKDRVFEKKVFEIAGPQDYTFDGIIDKIGEVLGRKRLKIHIPMSLMRANALFVETLLSNPPITRDALLMLEEDNITKENALPGVFGIEPTDFVEGMKTYLH